MSNKTKIMALAAAAWVVAFSATSASAVCICSTGPGGKCAYVDYLSMEECSRRIVGTGFTCVSNALGTGGSGESASAVLQRANGEAKLVFGAKAYPILVASSGGARILRAALERDAKRADPNALVQAFDAVSASASKKIDDRVANEVSQQFNARVESGKQ